MGPRKPAAKPAGKTVATIRHDPKRKSLPTVESQSLMRDAEKSLVHGTDAPWRPFFYTFYPEEQGGGRFSIEQSAPKV